MSDYTEKLEIVDEIADRFANALKDSIDKVVVGEIAKTLEDFIPTEYARLRAVHRIRKDCPDVYMSAYASAYISAHALKPSKEIEGDEADEIAKIFEGFIPTEDEADEIVKRFEDFILTEDEAVIGEIAKALEDFIPTEDARLRAAQRIYTKYPDIDISLSSVAAGEGKFYKEIERDKAVVDKITKAIAKTLEDFIPTEYVRFKAAQRIRKDYPAVSISIIIGADTYFRNKSIVTRYLRRQSVKSCLMHELKPDTILGIDIQEEEEDEAVVGGIAETLEDFIPAEDARLRAAQRIYENYPTVLISIYGEEAYFVSQSLKNYRKSVMKRIENEKKFWK